MSIETELDRLWSKAVRKVANNRCELCGNEGIHAHHIFTRFHIGTRWMLLNGVCLCAKCHLYAHSKINEFRARINRDIDILEPIAKRTCKFDLDDLETLKTKLKEYIK